MGSEQSTDNANAAPPAEMPLTIAPTQNNRATAVVSRNNRATAVPPQIVFAAVVRVRVVVSDYNLMCPYMENPPGEGSGSGFFIDDTHVLTCFHVVKDATSVSIDVGDRTYRARAIFQCPEMDIALLRVDGYKSTAHLILGDSSALKLGEHVLTCGYPLGTDTVKITSGSLSGYEKYYLQIDAPINPGNSGGPLFNSAYKVIGINAAKIEGASNVGYAIPIRYYQNVAAHIGHAPYVAPMKFSFYYMNVPPAVVDYVRKSTNQSAAVADARGGVLVTRHHRAANNPIPEGAVVYRVGDFYVDRRGMCARKDNANMKIPFEYVLYHFPHGDPVQIGCIVFENGRTVRSDITYTFDAEQHRNLAMLRDYDRVLSRSIEWLRIDGIVIQSLRLAHFEYLRENIFSAIKMDIADIIEYMYPENWDRDILFVSYVDPASEARATQDVSQGMVITGVGDSDAPVRTLAELRSAVTAASRPFFYLRTKRSRIYLKKSDSITSNKNKVKN